MLVRNFTGITVRVLTGPHKGHYPAQGYVPARNLPSGEPTGLPAYDAEQRVIVHLPVAEVAFERDDLLVPSGVKLEGGGMVAYELLPGDEVSPALARLRCEYRSHEELWAAVLMDAIEGVTPINQADRRSVEDATRLAARRLRLMVSLHPHGAAPPQPVNLTATLVAAAWTDVSWMKLSPAEQAAFTAQAENLHRRFTVVARSSGGAGSHGG